MKKRLLASFLSIMMVLTLLPATAMAAEPVSVETLEGLTSTIASADEGTVIKITKSFAITSPVTVNKAVTITSEEGVAITAKEAGDSFVLSNGATLDGLTIQLAVVNTAEVDIIRIASNATVKNCTISGQYKDGNAEVSRAIVINAGASGWVITGNTITNLRQPGYIEGMGTISNNYVAGTRGWVICANHETLIENNSFGENAVDIAIIPNGQGENAYAGKTAELSAANSGAYVENQPQGTKAEDGKLIIDTTCSLQNTIAEAQAGDTVTLLTDLSGLDTIVINDGQKVTLDLNGHNIGFAEGKRFEIRHGELYLVGKGTVYEEIPDFSPVILYGSPDEDIANYSVVTVGKDVTLVGWAGLFLNQNTGKENYGMVATVNGTLIGKADKNEAPGSGLYLNGTVKHTTGNVTKITINSGAKITAEKGNGMYLAGYAETSIENAEISSSTDGATGIEIRAGKLSIKDSVVNGGTGEVSITPNGNGSTTNNTAIAIAQHTTQLPLEVTIDGGTYTATAALNQTTPQDPAKPDIIKLSVLNGNFNGMILAENTSKFITGGDYTVDPSAYLAEGYTAVASEKAGYAYQVVEKIQTTVPVEPAVAEPSAPEPAELVKDLGLTQEQAKAVSDAAKSVEAPDLAAAAGSEANSITEKEAKALADKATEITPEEGKEVKLYVQTFLDVQPKEYNETAGTLKLEITPKYQIVASKAENADDINLEDKTHSVVVQEALPTEVSTTVTMSLTLPAEFVSGAAPSPAPSASPDPIYVQHSKDGVTYVYGTVLDSNTITFENPHGFSTFVVTKAAPVAKIGDIGYTSLQDAVDKVKDNETIVLQDNNAEKVLVSQAVVFTLNENGKTFTGSISAAPGYKLEKKENVYTVIRLADEEGTVTQTYAITVEASNGGTVTSNFNKASKNQTITLTAVAEEGYELKTLTVTDEDGNEIALTEKGEGKYTFTMPGSKVTGKATFATVTEESPFADVKADNWFYDAVMYVYDKGMMNGDAGMFSPNNNLTRGMIAQVLYNLEGKPEVTESAFTDVAEDAWYADAVNWAAKQGIVSGYGNGLFGPEDDITREQMALILYKYAEVKGYDITLKGDLTAFTDGEETSDWAKEAVEWAVGAKLISGKGNGQLDPTGTAIRAEVAQILMSFCENIVK